MVVFRRACHAGIAVAHEADVLHAGHLHGLPHLFLANGRKGFRRGEGRVADLSNVAVGANRNRHPGAPGNQHGQGAAAAEPLVVGMGEGPQYGNTGQVIGLIGHSGNLLSIDGSCKRTSADTSPMLVQRSASIVMSCLPDSTSNAFCLLPIKGTKSSVVNPCWSMWNSMAAMTLGIRNRVAVYPHTLQQGLTAYASVRSYSGSPGLAFRRSPIRANAAVQWSSSVRICLTSAIARPPLRSFCMGSYKADVHFLHYVVNMYHEAIYVQFGTALP